jgi:hypothetical protein
VLLHEDGGRPQKHVGEYTVYILYVQTVGLQIEIFISGMSNNSVL